MECWEFKGLFCQSFEDKSVEDSASDGGLTHKLSERNKVFTIHLCGESMVSGQLELKN